MHKFKKTNIYKYVILIILLVGIFTLKQYSYTFLYTNPETNTKAFKYIASTSNEINKLISKSVNNLKTDIPKAKLLYTLGYGSVFLKNNQAVSDYDYGAGIYLGEYIFTGENSNKIAESIVNSAILFQTSMYSLAQTSSQRFYVPKIPKKRDNYKFNKITIQNCIQKVSSGKPCDTRIGNNDIVLNEEEIILPDYGFVELYSRNINYSPECRKIFRELTINLNYYFDLKDPKSGTKKRITIITKNKNKLFNYKFISFVPNAFTTFKSLNYILKLNPGKDEYTETRFKNYFLHYSYNEYGNIIASGNPLKKLKRLLQCTNILSPILPKHVVNEINEKIYTILSDRTLVLINDYYVTNNILYNFSQTNNINNNTISIIDDLEKILSEMINDERITYEELKPLFKYQKKLSRSQNNIRELNYTIKVNANIINKYIENLMIEKIPNYKRFSAYTEYLNKVLTTGGIKSIKIYQDKPNHIYVFKREDLSSLSNLRDIELLNGYNRQDIKDSIQIEYISPSLFSESSSKVVTVWYRKNTTKMEDAVFEDMKNYLGKDRRSIHLYAGIRRNY